MRSVEYAKYKTSEQLSLKRDAGHCLLLFQQITVTFSSGWFNGTISEYFPTNLIHHLLSRKMYMLCETSALMTFSH